MINRGLLYAAVAYICWGLLPIFWKSLIQVPALEILAHRMAWALVVAALLVSLRGRWNWLGPALRDRRTLAIFVCSALLLSLNWLIYIWAVNAGHIVESSLGYFINPLVNVLLGVLFLRERLRRVQLVAVLIALVGVIYLTVQVGTLPWIALVLAFTFGLYGLIRKTAKLNSLEGFALETLLMVPFALAYLIFRELNGQAAFGHAGLTTSALLAASGAITAVPLLLFAAGARRISMTTLGLLQYIAPTLQFSLGVLVYGEHLSADRLIGFAFIWLALAIYTIESVNRSANAARVRALTSELRS